MSRQLYLQHPGGQVLTQLETFSDLIYLEVSLGDCENDLERLIVIELDSFPVDVEKDGGRQPSKTPIAVDQSMIGHYRVQQSSGLEVDSGVGVFPKGTRPGCTMKSSLDPHRPENVTKPYSSTGCR
jgi:hypothetical protein